MTPSLTRFIRSVEEASEENATFQAVEAIEGPGLKVQASVRRAESRQIHVDYTAYECAWQALEETLYGHVEFLGDELRDLQLRYDAGSTWVYDPSNRTAIHKPGRQLFEPIPGVTMLGEISFLATIARDFLLRDLGEQSWEGGKTRRIGLKPKSSYRSHLLSVVTFPIRRATLDVDLETLFPVRIAFVPTPGSPAASIVGPQATVTITYTDVQKLDGRAGSAPFEPPEDARVFIESSHTSLADLAQSVPFPMLLSPIHVHGFVDEGSSIDLALDHDHQRGYALVSVSPGGSDADSNSPNRLTILVGNYVSRNMARRRAAFSEAGYPAASDSSVRLVARSALWEERLPGIETTHAPVEAFFEHDGVFWFLSATGMDLDSIEAIARDLLQAQSGGNTAPDEPAA